MKRVCVLGCGRLGRIVALGLAAGKVHGVELAGVYSRSLQRTEALAAETGCTATGSLAELMDLKPDYVVEAATGQALLEALPVVLAGGADLVVLSASPLAEAEVWTWAEETARAHDRRIYLAAGVAAGFDLMTAARLMGGLEVSFTKRKPPAASDGADPALAALADRFCGTAAQACRRYPDHLNVAAAVALATCGPEYTPVRVEPGETVSFTTKLTGAFGRAELYTELGTRSPELAAWSALAVLERLNRRISL